MSVFDVSGQWDAQQSNGAVASFDLRHRGTQGVIHGHASHSGGSVLGDGEGVIQGTAFHLVVRWNNGTMGEYNGTFAINGRVSGVTFDLLHPQSQATWFSSRFFQEVERPRLMED